MIPVSFIVPEGFQMMGLAALSVFEMANRALEKQAYDIGVYSVDGGLLRSSHGLSIETQRIRRTFADTTIAVGTMTPWVPASSKILAHLEGALKGSRRVAGICTGAFVLAEAGLLSGRRATTHWSYADRLQEMYPEVVVDSDRIFIGDGKVWTSAGMSAGVDLALALVEDDFGAELAKNVARRLVIYHRRPGGQSQFSALIELEPETDRIRRVLSFAKENLTNELSVEELAGVASLSPRQFSRLFTQETGQSPAKAVEKLRLEAARAMMEGGNYSFDVVARATGFADRERMRRAFLRNFGQPPSFFQRTGHSLGNEEAASDA